MAAPTTEANLAQRVKLAEAWYDLLSQEGFSYLQQKNVDASEGRKEVLPWLVREKANEALARGDASDCVRDGAVATRVPEHDFEDVVCGRHAGRHVRAEAWTPVVFESVQATDGRVRLHVRAGQLPMELALTFPAVGGVRLEGAKAGALCFGLADVAGASGEAERRLVDLRATDWMLPWASERGPA